MSLVILPTRRVEVITLDHRRDVVDRIRGHDVTYEETIVLSKDKYKQLLGDNNARTSISIATRMGGPYGYSSVSINCSVTLSCNQDDATIQKAKMAAFQECISFCDEAMPHCMRLLNSQLEDLYTTEGG